MLSKSDMIKLTPKEENECENFEAAINSKLKEVRSGNKYCPGDSIPVDVPGHLQPRVQMELIRRFKTDGDWTLAVTSADGTMNDGTIHFQLR